MHDKRKIKDIPKENRPYEKCLRYGEQSLTDAELLAILLRTGSSGQSSLSLAQSILDLSRDCDGLQGLYHLSLQQLKGIHGIGTVKGIQLKCLGELSKRIATSSAEKGLSFEDPQSIACYYMERLRHETQEHLLCMMLDGKTAVSEKKLSLRER